MGFWGFGVFFTDFNYFWCSSRFVCCIPLFIRMFNKLCSILRHECVHDVPEVLSIRHTTFRKFSWEIKHELFVLLHLWPEAENRQFIVLRHVDSLNTIEFKQFLFFTQNFFKKVFVHPLHTISSYELKTYMYSGGK